MEPCLCDRCVGIEYADQARQRIVALREKAERWERRVSAAQLPIVYMTFASIGAMLLGFIWHAALLNIGWHDPLDRWWLYNGILATLATSFLAAVGLDKLLSRIDGMIGDLKKSEENLLRSTNNIVTTRGWLRDNRNCRRSA